MKNSSALLLAGVLVGCGSSTIQLPTTTPDVLRTGGSVRAMQTLTDIETVRDIASSGDRVFVATDGGLFVYVDADASRVETPDNDVRAVALTPNGAAYVASATGVVRIDGNTTTPVQIPDVGSIVAMRMAGESLFVCGTSGLARGVGESFARFGDGAQCTGLFPTPQGQLWVGTTRGAWLVEDDVVHEHAEGRGLPAGYIRSIVPMPEGQAFALVQDANESHLAYFDGLRWYGYTIDGFEQPVVGLARGDSGDVLLFGQSYAFRIDDAARAQGVRLTALSRGERLQVLSYRGGEGPARAATEAVPSRTASRLTAVPPNHPTIDAPAWVIAPLGPIGSQAYLVRDDGTRAFVADRNRGVVPVTAQGPGDALRTRSLVASRDLQVASDARGDTWVVTDGGVVARYERDHLVRVAGPEGARVGAIAAASRGVYLASTVPGRPNVVQIHRREGEGWTLVVEKTLFGAAPVEDAPDPEAGDAVAAVPGAVELLSTPMLGVRDDEEIWVALRVRASTESPASGAEGRLRGVAVFRGDGPIVYHHRGATAATDGEGALQMPDDFSNIDLDQPEMAWFSTIVGAVRLGNSQAVTFGEARGVRGEVVSDVLVGTQNKIWVAAAEGPGYYFQQTFEFRMPQAVREARPIALTLDGQGRVWAAGPSSLLRYDDGDWAIYGEEQGLPNTGFMDIESDAGGRLWVLGRDRVLVLGAPESAPAGE